VEIALDGALDLDSAPMVRDLAVAAIHVGRPIIRLDTSAVTFIDRSGHDALVDALTHASSAGVALVLCAPSNRVLDMLLLSGMDNLFVIDSFSTQ
jgi:anti-sigma B factor antagonist